MRHRWSRWTDVLRFRNPDAASGPHGTARPGTLILDREGQVHGKLFGVDYTEPEGVAALLAELSAADVSETAVAPPSPDP